MGLRDIPPTPDAFNEFVRGYEARELKYDPTNQRLAEATIAIMATWLPQPLRRPPVVSCLVTA